jgi:tRNA A-37 threonylcarbamoyl transferase component Bud32
MSTTSIGKYKLMEEMGVGAVGSTYHASDTFRNREMVLKVLNPAIINTPELREQICRDLSASAELRHPHIVKVRDLGEVDGTIYIATELVNGVDLRWHIERRILSMADKIDLMVQVCGALAFAHSKGVAHGNIKPGNIFVTGKDATVLDFGIGKCLASIVEAGARPAALLPNYLAPEQVLGKPFKAKSDVFSVAVVLYELLVKYPFPADANLISREIVHTVPEPLRKLDPEIPEELEQLMIRALEKDPEKRLERVDEFAAGLYLISQKLRGPGAAPAAVTDLDPPVALAAPAFAPTYASAPPAPVVPIPVLLQTPPAAVPAPPVTAPAPLPAAPPLAVAQPVKRAPAPPPIGSKMRWIPYAIAAVLTFCISLSFLSRQSIHASQIKPAATATAQAPNTPQVTQPVASPAPQTPATVAPAEALPATESAPVKPSEEQVALNQVKALWASGKYTQALEKVDDFLADHPENMEGRIWKKKIRSAQDAEAAMK